MDSTGIDEHKDKRSLTAVDEAGIVVKRAKLRNEASNFLLSPLNNHSNEMDIFGSTV